MSCDLFRSKDEPYVVGTFQTISKLQSHCYLWFLPCSLLLLKRNPPPPPVSIMVQTKRRPCSRCRTRQRACLWRTAGVRSCIRCHNMGKECSGPVGSTFLKPSPEDLASRRRRGYLTTAHNIARSCTSNALGEGATSAALTYELVSVYQQHLRRLPDLDPDLEPFRQRLLTFTGSSGVPGADEVIVLVSFRVMLTW